MDPLTIVTGCASLLLTVTKLSVTISGFVRTCRDARTDMDLVKRDLTSLSSVLELIEGDVKEHGEQVFPETLARQIDGIIKNCDGVVGRISELLTESSGVINGAKWAMGRKVKMLELRASLEAHKTSLELALELVQLNLARETNNNTHTIMNDTRELRDVTSGIARDTSDMKVDIEAVLEELARLRLQVGQQNEQAKGEQESIMLERYLHDMASYAETVNGDLQDMPEPGKTSLDSLREDQFEHPAVVDKETAKGTQLIPPEVAVIARTAHPRNEAQEILNRGLDTEPRSPEKEIRGFNLPHDQRLEDLQFINSSSSFNNSNKRSPYSPERKGLPEDQVSSAHTLIMEQMTSTQPSLDATISRTGNLGNKIVHGEQISQLPSQGEIEGGKSAVANDEAINKLSADQVLLNSSQVGLKSPQENRGTTKKFLGYFGLKTQKRKASKLVPDVSPSSNIVCIHYSVGKKICERSSTIVFKGVNILNNHPVAIIFEPSKEKTLVLRDEYGVYKSLIGCPGIPVTYYFGQERLSPALGLYNILITDLYDPCLEDLFDLCLRRFSPKTVVMVGKQMLSCIQYIHENNLIVRNINPRYFGIGQRGTKAENAIHIINLSRAKYYRHSKTKQHIPYKERKEPTGAPIYMSINAHMGREQSRRDDLEAICHVFMLFLRGGLPWQGMGHKHKEIGEKKQTTSIQSLCEGFPDEFVKFFSYVRNLGFEDTPDYDYLRDLLTQALRSTGEVEDGIYDWMNIKGGYQ